MVALIAPPVVQMGKAQVTLAAGAVSAGDRARRTDPGAARPRQHRQGQDRTKTALDLFCGLGPFSLRLAEGVRVTAIDSDQPALDALARAAQATPGLKQVTVQKRDLFRLPLSAMELSAFDAVIFDPPRQGAEAQAREIAKSKVKAIVAVSCNAATFARDAAILIAGGYRLRARDAGGSVQIHRACGDRRAVRAVKDAIRRRLLRSFPRRRESSKKNFWVSAFAGTSGITCRDS